MEHGMNAGITDQLSIVGEDVWLTVPPFSEFLRTVRLVAADAASRAGLDYEEIDDVRIAVSELCSLVSLDATTTVTLSFVADEGELTVGGPLAPLGDLSRTIIDSVADFHETYEHDTEIGFSVLKESRAPAVDG